MMNKLKRLYIKSNIYVLFFVSMLTGVVVYVLNDYLISIGNIILQLAVFLLLCLPATLCMVGTSLIQDGHLRLPEENK